MPARYKTQPAGQDVRRLPSADAVTDLTVAGSRLKFPAAVSDPARDQANGPSKFNIQVRWPSTALGVGTVAVPVWQTTCAPFPKRCRATALQKRKRDAGRLLPSLEC